ncbi:putative oxidoreductase GLYR1 homolog [Trichonephila clavata]|uniref:Putative oxidoreductase GLYR1 homolog n=1 Tax=Trichonephila clavata TaxID=2740835 RepID=A0A8X6J9H5_TRICU|nr:putative oxidoreductase GLYR1 homolog [Trichonephila clavata]
MTSIDSDTSQVIAEAISERGGRYLEAPITGSLSAAEEGTLLIICAGDLELFKSCETCFFSTAKNTLHMNCDVGSASKMNLIHSMLMSTSNAVLAEQMVVLERNNIPKSKLLDVIQLDSISCPLFSESGRAIVDQNFSTNTSLKYQQQNLHMALALSSSYAQPLRMASASNELYKATKSLGYSEHDMSAVYFGARH